ncbi:hypothetical protein MKJ04_14480 [Pontibacter sp. E15-1]|uniref:hypothetical protein n=1 Tax=Pontibacter sp. E15-1 TaxID=2919918 RepID=UPI001F4FAF2B|nr:hypothetical protein [Pontibacter sp. E15-1]MCJ8166050.1 hypothetical protein [Pontibacter sp. E15-1]
MINIGQVNELMGLERTMNELNHQLTTAFFKSYRSAIEEIGAEFLRYFQSKGLTVSTKEDTRSSPQSKYFIASQGRVEFSLRCQYRVNSSSTEYFDLEVTDDNFKKTNQLIDIKPNREMHAYGIERDGTTEEKITKTREHIQSLQEQIKEVGNLTYSLSLRDGYKKIGENVIPNITALLGRLAQ